MKVRDILSTKKRRGEILQVKHSDVVSAAIGIMVSQDTGSVAVFEDEAFIGMLTFREILIVIHKKGIDAINSVSCQSIVGDEGACATPEDSVDQIRAIMTNKHIRYLPVIIDGKLSDVISFYDVARSVAKAFDFENKMLKEYIRSWPTPEDEE